VQRRYDRANKFIVTAIREREINHGQPAQIYTASLLLLLLLLLLAGGHN